MTDKDKLSVIDSILSAAWDWRKTSECNEIFKGIVVAIGAVLDTGLGESE
ncbi:MAG: hypothetical protein J6Q10_03755 [Clostridia bacterium]|nr:hypothetical protein [Clostridia bacterium]